MNLMTTLGLVLGWVVAFVIVVITLRRFPFSIVQELIVVFSGVVAGILSAWFELRFIPAYARSMSAGRMLLSRTLFYVIMLRFSRHVSGIWSTRPWQLSHPTPTAM